MSNSNDHPTTKATDIDLRTEYAEIARELRRLADRAREALAVQPTGYMYYSMLVNDQQRLDVLAAAYEVHAKEAR